MLYLDSCIPMYLVGASHPNKQRILSLLPNLVAGGEPFVSSVEAFQEIIHRYRALKDEKHMEAAYSALEQMVQGVEPVRKEDADSAKALSVQLRKNCPTEIASMRR